MKIVAINGSPRKEGNTAALIKAMVEEHEDTDLVYFDLIDMKIKDCIACMNCKTHDSCSIKDDMGKIYTAIKECDAMVIGSPIYMGTETGMTKCMLDRMFALLAPVEGPKRYAPRLAPGKKAIVVFTSGNPTPEQSMSYQKDRFYSTMAMQGISQVKVYMVGGALPSKDIMERAEVPKIISEAKEFLRH